MFCFETVPQSGLGLALFLSGNQIHGILSDSAFKALTFQVPCLHPCHITHYSSLIRQLIQKLCTSLPKENLDLKSCCVSNTESYKWLLTCCWFMYILNKLKYFFFSLLWILLPLLNKTLTCSNCPQQQVLWQKPPLIPEDWQLGSSWLSM